jgi:apolipoprotein N-acyltransferase
MVARLAVRHRRAAVELAGHDLGAGEAISQSASIWGIYGLSALTVVAMAAPATLADARTRGTTGSRAVPVIVAAIRLRRHLGLGRAPPRRCAGR